MIRYGKMAQGAISVMSRLAEVYDQDALLSSKEAGEARGLAPSFAAKLLSLLSQHGLLESTPGPRGGYRLAKSPGKIRLLDIVRVFEPTQRPMACPYGENWCGNGPQCPLHDLITKLEEQSKAFLEGTTLRVFAQSQRA